jgi:asparagine synthase (glutamine-hydrolysing)
MCGIAGVVSIDHDPRLGAIAERMNEVLVHRGPDGEGAYVCPTGHAALVHRRLAIIDLNAGAQPMHDHECRRTIVFNGEIYNYRELRTERLASAYQFATESDTEVILAAHAAWGDEMLSRLRGMFAFGIWDRARQSLLLARDRFGEKPLFYVERDGRLYFASELKAIQRVLPLDVDPVALAEYLVLGYVPGSRTMYRGVRRLLPGHSLRFTVDGTLSTHEYWSLPLPEDQESDRAASDWEAAIATRLQEAVRLRLIADVPLGAFLSGGLDSSTIVALCVAQADRPFHTYSIRPRDAHSPDADAAQEVSKLLGTTHHEELLDCPTPDELLELFHQFDEPFADSSMIPTAAVSRAARRHVTVALSGDGGDEMFGGYGVYRDYRNLSSMAAWPMVSRAALGLDRVLPKHAPGSVSLALLHADPGKRYLQLVAHLWNGPLARLLGGPGDVLDEALAELAELFQFPVCQPEPGPVARAQWIDASRGYLSGDILPKVDLASMVHSLEVRAPFLDHLLAQDLSRLPDSLRMDARSGRGKLLLRRIARRYLPEHIIERQKVGFSVPLTTWLRGPLRPLIDTYILDSGSPLAQHVDLPSAQAMATEPGLPQRSRLQFSLLSLAVWAQSNSAVVGDPAQKALSPIADRELTA